MPTYEYQCDNCGLHFDYFQKMSDPHLETCIECQGNVRRVPSGGTGLIFKGSGFYITDYSNKKNGKSTTSNPSKSSKKENASPKKTLGKTEE